MVLLIEWLGLAQHGANTSLTSGRKLRQHSTVLYWRVPGSTSRITASSSQHAASMLLDVEAMDKHKPSKQLSRLTGHQKQSCFAYTRALEIHGVGSSRKEGQNACDDDDYCVGWARRINLFLLFPSATAAAPPNLLQEGSLGLCSSPFLTLNLSPYNRRSWPRPRSLFTSSLENLEQHTTAI